MIVCALYPSTLIMTVAVLPVGGEVGVGGVRVLCAINASLVRYWHPAFLLRLECGNEEIFCQIQVRSEICGPIAQIPDRMIHHAARDIINLIWLWVMVCGCRLLNKPGMRFMRELACFRTFHADGFIKGHITYPG